MQLILINPADRNNNSFTTSIFNHFNNFSYLPAKFNNIIGIGNLLFSKGKYKYFC